MTVVGTAEVLIVGKDMLTGQLEKGATTATNNVAAQTEKAGARMRQTFRTAFGALSTAFGPAFAPLQEMYDKFDQISQSAENMRGKVGKSLLVVGGVATTV